MIESNKFKEIYDLLKKLKCKYETHYSGEEGEYDYLKENDLCITVKNPYNNIELYIDYAIDEITLSFSKWHTHYFDDSIYDYILHDIEAIITNQKCLIIVSSNKRWLSSTIYDKPLNKNYDYQINIKSLPKEFITEIASFGGNVELFYWNPTHNIKFEIEKSK